MSGPVFNKSIDIQYLTRIDVYGDIVLLYRVAFEAEGISKSQTGRTVIRSRDVRTVFDGDQQRAIDARLASMVRLARKARNKDGL